eukprot:scaffold4621_cov128-Isochrysis_galbana.AAC.10
MDPSLPRRERTATKLGSGSRPQYLHVVDGPIVRVRACEPHSAEGAHAAGDAAEDGVLAI